MKVTPKRIEDYVDELVLMRTVPYAEILMKVRLRFVCFGIVPALAVAKKHLKTLAILGVVHDN